MERFLRSLNSQRLDCRRFADKKAARPYAYPTPAPFFPAA